MEIVKDFLFSGSKITADGDCSHEIKRCLLLGRKAMSNLDSILKSRNITLPANVRLVKAMVFPVVMYGCESWTTKNLGAEELMLSNCVVGEYSREYLGLQGDQIVNPKGNQSWIFIGRTDAEAKALILWSLISKTPNAGKDWRQEEKGVAEDEIVGWHHWLYGHEFEQALGDGEGQGSLARCSPWSHKDSGMTEGRESNKIRSGKRSKGAGRDPGLFCATEGERAMWLFSET